MTDLSQQQYFSQPPVPQVTYDPYATPQQMDSRLQGPSIIHYAPTPSSAPVAGVPQQQVPYNWNGYETPVYVSAPPQFLESGHASLPLTNVPLQDNKSFKEGEEGYEYQGGFDGEQGHSYPNPHLRRERFGISCSDVLHATLNWYADGWHMYVENWIPYTMLSLFFLFVLGGNVFIDGETHSTVFSAISILSFPLSFGWFLAGTYVLKEKERLLREGGEPVKITPRLGDFFRGYYVFFPLWGYSILLSLFTSLGLLLFIIPGLYLFVTLSFVPFVYLEYHRQESFEQVRSDSPVSYDFCESIGVSRRVVHQYFWEVAFFLLIQIALLAIGFITVVGSLVTLPVAALAFIPAFRALFQFQMGRLPDDRCYCCC